MLTLQKFVSVGGTESALKKICLVCYHHNSITVETHFIRLALYIKILIKVLVSM